MWAQGNRGKTTKKTQDQVISETTYMVSSIEIAMDRKRWRALADMGKSQWGHKWLWDWYVFCVVYIKFNGFSRSKLWSLASKQCLNGKQRTFREYSLLTVCPCGAYLWWIMLWWSNKTVSMAFTLLCDCHTFFDHEDCGVFYWDGCLCFRVITIDPCLISRYLVFH